MSLRTTQNPLSSIFSDDLQLSAEDVETVSRIRRQIETSACTGCKLHKARGKKKPVPGQGRGRIMFVGHAIGRAEEKRTLPAIGRASKHGIQLFYKVLPEANSWGVTKNNAREWMLDYAYYTNTTRCGASENPTASDHKRCAGAKGPNWLSVEVSYVDPVIIVFQNKVSARAVLGKGNVPSRGEVVKRFVYGTLRPVMLMAHPVSVAWSPEERDTVLADYKALAIWLYEEEYITKPLEISQTRKATHHLVTTKDELEAMKNDLMDNPFVALDSETFFNADLDHFRSILNGGHEGKKGALLWHSNQFEMVCYQIAGLSFAENGEAYVENTWTVALRFRDRMTGTPRQNITPEEGLKALDEILQKDLTSICDRERVVFMWNALFDCPVFTQDGIDLWGMTHQRYPIRIWDGQQIMVRLNEHLGRKEGRTTLDNASAIYLQERKGKFTDRFDPKTFAYENIEDPVVRAEVLDYCGEDPRKTALACWHLFQDLDDHIDKRKQHLSTSRSSHHPIGMYPFPKVSAKHTSARIRDVALPLDHQMIPLIGEMTAIGFKVKQQPVDEAKEKYEDLLSRLENKITLQVPGFNPNSAQHTLRLVKRTQVAISKVLTRLIQNHPNKKYKIAESFQVYIGRNEEKVKPKDITSAFERVYGELTGERSVILDKYMIYYSVSYTLLQDVAEKLDEEIHIQENLQPEAVESFFNAVFLYKQLDKKWSTYFERFTRITDRHSVLHPEYSLTSTLSGRYSGNFQNVPRGGEEDREFVESLLECLDMLPEATSKEKEEKRNELIDTYNRFDVRQACYPPQPRDLNRMFKSMNLRYQEGSKKGEHWRVDDKQYVVVCADFAAQEDRMAYALSGDKTKARLLSNPNLDTHFYNVAFCFGSKHGFDTSTPEGQMEAYHYFTKQKEIQDLKDEINRLIDEGDASSNVGSTLPKDVQTQIESMRKEIRKLKKERKKYKRKYRTPMKTVHYASQYGAGAEKLHTVIKPIFISMGEDWTIEDTEELKAKYDQLYAGVTKAREEILEGLKKVPYVEYPVFGTLRHAKVAEVGKVQDALSVANALNQGTCAYITKLAMLRMRYLIDQNKERWGLVQAGGSNYVGTLLQVHDEIAIICPVELATEVSKSLESAMKIIVEPGEALAYYNETVPDARGKTGWLAIQDNDFKGQTLLDADAEVKRTVAKAKTLANGQKNFLAKMDEQESMIEFQKKHPFVPYKDVPLVLASKDNTPYFI